LILNNYLLNDLTLNDLILNNYLLNDLILNNYLLNDLILNNYLLNDLTLNDLIFRSECRRNKDKGILVDSRREGEGKKEVRASGRGGRGVGTI